MKDLYRHIKDIDPDRGISVIHMESNAGLPVGGNKILHLLEIDRPCDRAHTGKLGELGIFTVLHDRPPKE